MSPLRRLVVLPALAALALPAAAHASPTQLSVMMDDDNLLYRGDAVRDQTLRRMKALGVDEVRVTVLWSVVADGARSTRGRDRRFRRLGADDPRAYPRLNWDRYDRLDRACATLQIGCYFNVTGPAPDYAHAAPPRRYARLGGAWKPSPRQFKLFVKALGRRYSGGYRDENDGHVVLPRVSFWSLWNEPNQAGWLAPQWSGGRPFAPGLYRGLYRAGHQALEATGHGSDTILLGETAPLALPGRTAKSSMYPGVFLRSLFCVDGAGRPVASDPGCADFSRFGPLPATAWAHHPYAKKEAPTAPTTSPDAFPLSNLAGLTGLLDAIAANTGRVRAELPVAITEFGYETNPPDPYQGVSLDQQTAYLNTADFMAWRNPRVVTQTQFLLRDVPPLSKHRRGSKAYWFTYQSGLFFADGSPKPAATAYGLPFVGVPFGQAEDGRPQWAFWGQLRFRPKGTPDSVTLQFRPADGSTGWVALGDPVAVDQARNFFTAVRPLPGPGQVRAAWTGGVFPFVWVGRPVDVG